VKVNEQDVKRLVVVGVVTLVLGIGLVGAATVASSGSLLKGPEQYVEQLTTKLTRTGSFTQRSQMRDQAIAIIKVQPIFGVGIEGITPFLRHYPTSRSQNDVIALNNQFLELIAEAGTIGAILFYAFLILLMLLAIRSIRNLNESYLAWTLGLIGALVAITVQAQSFSGFLLTHIWVSYGLLAGFIAYANSRNKHKLKKSN